jgi:hypothetical protein
MDFIFFYRDSGPDQQTKKKSNLVAIAIPFEDRGRG